MRTLTSFQRKLRSHLVLLYDRKSGDNGSGVLIQVEERIYVVTAAHILFNDLHINLGLEFHSSSMTILDQWADDKLDIAFLELKPFEVEIYRHNEAAPFKVGRKTVTEIPMGKKQFALYGYPSNQQKQSNQQIAFIPLYLGCLLLPFELWSDFVRSKKTPATNFVIPTGEKHGSNFIGEDGQPMKIEPYGMSGCGLWFCEPGTENSDPPAYGLLGIQNSNFPQSQVVSGTYIEPIFDAIMARRVVGVNNKGTAAA